MGETPDQIERQITAERVELGQNLRELQSKVEQTVDWRVQFAKRPMALLGAAFGGGLLLAFMTTGKRSRTRY